MARDALKRGEPDAISNRTLQQVLTAAAKIYAAKVERRGHDVAPFALNAVTATETVVTACGMIRAADLNMFDVAIWFIARRGSSDANRGDNSHRHSRESGSP